MQPIRPHSPPLLYVDMTGKTAILMITIDDYVRVMASPGALVSTVRFDQSIASSIPLTIKQRFLKKLIR